MSIPSPAADPPARHQQHDAGGTSHNAVLGVNAHHAGLMTGQEARQLVSRHQEVNRGDDKQDDTKKRENKFHGSILKQWSGSARLDSLRGTNLQTRDLQTKTRIFMAEVVNNQAQHRYELVVEGHLAATYYSVADGVITFIHTEVPPELGGKGAGSALVKGALDQVRAEGLKVIPQCPFVKAYIDKHPEYADLLKG